VLVRPSSCSSGIVHWLGVDCDSAVVVQWDVGSGGDVGGSGGDDRGSVSALEEAQAGR